MTARRWRRTVAAGCCVALTEGVVLLAVAAPSGLGPVPLLATLVLAPMAVVYVLVGEYLIGLPWVLGIIDANPDDYSDAWVFVGAGVAGIVNAGLYLWLYARHRRHRAGASS